MRKLFSFLMVGLFLTAFQVVAVEAERGDGDRVDTRDTRGGDSVDTRDTRGGDRVETRDPRGAPPRDPRAAPPRDPRVRDSVDTRDPRDGDSVDTRDPREELRATLKNCRQMKKAGKLTKAMKQECKAARQLKKQNRQ